MMRIERQVTSLKAAFYRLMTVQKGGYQSQEELDSLFDLGPQSSGVIHQQVQAKIKEIQARNYTAEIEKKLCDWKLAGDDNEGSTDCSLSKNSPRSEG